ncbi:MAG: Xaa-Pro peptidase family protein [Gammaproteobacteria bacterium]|nr:Xaa-Pro peptidase family protein [Gammaproteobacteria bacterium]
MTTREVFFEPDEYARRLQAVQQAMAGEGLDLLVTCSPGNICYLTGYVSMNVLDIMFLCVPAEGTPVFYLWQFERGRAESTVVAGETVCWETGDDPIVFMVEGVRSRKLDRGRTGVDTGSTYTSFDVVRRLLDALEAEPVKGVVETVRLVKSPLEHRYIREAATITDKGVAAAIDAVGEGASDYAICRAACDAMFDADTEFLCIEPMICVGWRAGSPHSPRGGTRAQQGDSVFIEMSGVRARYNAPLMRTTVVGKPRPEIQELADYSNACVDALLDTIKPGVLGSDVAAAGKAALKPIRDRISFHDLFAYPVGIGFPPNWIENPAFYLSADNHNPLIAGMVFHLPLTLRVLGQYGAGFSEALIVTETGAESLSKLPRTLI